MDESHAFHVAARRDVGLPALRDDDRPRVVVKAKRICAYHNLMLGQGVVEVALA